MFPLISSPGLVTVANEMFPHFPWEWKFLSLISSLRYEEHSKCRNEAAESKPCRPSRTFTEPFLRSFFQSTSVLSTSSGWHRQQEWKMVTSLKNKTDLWLNYLQSRRYHLARCAKSSFSYISLNRRGKVGKFAALETRRGPERQAWVTDETKIWFSQSAKQRRNPCSRAPHLCTSIWLRAMFGLLKKAIVELPIIMRGNSKRTSGNRHYSQFPPSLHALKDWWEKKQCQVVSQGGNKWYMLPVQKIAVEFVYSRQQKIKNFSL